MTPLPIPDTPAIDQSNVRPINHQTNQTCDVRLNKRHVPNYAIMIMVDTNINQITTSTDDDHDRCRSRSLYCRYYTCRHETRVIQVLPGKTCAQESCHTDHTVPTRISMRARAVSHRSCTSQGANMCARAVSYRLSRSHPEKHACKSCVTQIMQISPGKKHACKISVAQITQIPAGKHACKSRVVNISTGKYVCNGLVKTGTTPAHMIYCRSGYRINQGPV